MRILGLDVGEKRIGMAISDPFGITAQPAGFIERGSLAQTLGVVREVIGRYNVGTIIIGLPLSMSGAEGTSARGAREFSDQVTRSLNVPIVMWDERLTTAEAEKLMKSAGLSRKKRMRHIDEVAAQLILQSYLDSHS